LHRLNSIQRSTPTSNVRQQWPLLPLGLRAQLAQGTWEALVAYTQRAQPGGGALACVGVDAAVNQVRCALSKRVSYLAS